MINNDLVRAGTLNDLPPHMALAVTYLARYRDGTFLLYKRYLHQFLTWCESEGLDPLALERGHIEFYVRSLSDNGRMASTVNTAMTPVKGYYQMAHQDGVMSHNPTAYIRLPKIQRKKKKQYVDRSDLRQFFRVAKDISPRHWALSQLLGVMGLRISEAISITVEQAQHVENGIRVVHYIGKGNKPSWTPIPYQMLSAIDAAINGRDTGLVIAKLDGGRLSRHGATGLIETINRRAGLDVHINPHYLRALAITHGKEAGLSTDELREFARHEDERTTRRHYILTSMESAQHPVHTIAARLAI